MADIFLSYSQEDRERAKQIAEALQTLGWDVWWERPSARHTQKVARFYNSAKCVLVLWSKASWESGFVVDEALAATIDTRLVQAVLEKVNLSRSFRRITSANLKRWDGDTNATEFCDLRRRIARRVKPTPVPLTSVPHPASAEQSTFPSAEQSTPPRRVFLCYRRQDTQGHTGRLRDRLVTAYGKDAVFMDVDDVPHGVDFVEYIEGVLASCAAMVVLIGKEWATIADRKGRRRLDLADDLVRVEIAAALKGKIPVIPILVEDASMPDAEDVPDDIRGLSRRTTIELTHRRWDSDVQQVLKVIEKVMGAAKAGS